MVASVEPVWAQSFTVPNGTTETTTQTLADNQTGTVEAGGSISVTGDNVDGIVAGNGNTITNAGSVQTGGNVANAIDVLDNNTITNSGTLTTLGTGSISIFGEDDNTITSSGTINVNGGFSFGINVNDGNSITQSGTINLNGDPAVGILANDNNTVVQSGTIIGMLATPEGSAGIVVDDDSTVSNSGLIALTNTGGGFLLGILGEVSNTLNNTGQIVLGGDNSFGIAAESLNTITNSGLIVINGSDSAGIEAEDGNTINHSGTILAVGDVTDGIFALDGNMIVSSGSILTSGSDSDGINFADNNMVMVTGLVVPVGNDSDGINAGANNDVSVFGTILTVGSSSDGVDFEDEGNTLTVGGTIITAGPMSDAIDFDGTGNTLNLLAGLRVQGGVSLSSGIDTLNVGNGLDLNFTFDAANGLPEIINTNGAPFVTNGNTIAVLDETALSLTDDLLADITNGQSSSVFNALNSGRGQGRTTIATHGGGDQRGGSRWHSWTHLYGGLRRQTDDGSIADAYQGYGGTVSGWQLGELNGTRFGVFGASAFARTEVDDNSQDIDTRGFSGGVYAGMDTRFGFLNALVSGGYLEQESNRQVANNLVVGGIERLDADYDGYSVSAAIEAGWQTALGQQSIDVVGTLGYAGLFLEDYNETGPTQSIAINDRDIHVLTTGLRVQSVLHREETETGHWSLTGYAGADARFSIGDDTIDAVLLGQSITFDPDDDDVVGSLYVGATGHYNISSNVAFTTGVESRVDSERAWSISARTGLDVRF